MAQESMFWEVVSENVLEVPDKNLSADYEHVWRVQKDRMESAMGAAWTDLAWSQRSLQLRECALRDFCGILVDDRLFNRDSYCKHAVMDKISGWEDVEKWVGSKFKMSVMTCTNWVGAGTFDNHEWVSQSTITEQEEADESGPENGNANTSCQIWTTRCGETHRMIGKSLCQKRKKVPGCQIEHSKFPTEMFQFNLNEAKYMEESRQKSPKAWCHNNYLVSWMLLVKASLKERKFAVCSLREECRDSSGTYDV